MITDHENKVKLMLFIGCPLTAELRLQLTQSLEWKQAKINPIAGKDLEETHYQQKDFIGFFVKQEKITIQDLKQIEIQILQRINQYCPHFASEKIRILVFSQIFIS